MNLDNKFIKTEDFNKFINPQKALILGAKLADFDQIWELYIAVKIAIKRGKEGYDTGENLDLSEFPVLRAHFDRFRGKDTAKYTREELGKLMVGLESEGDEMIRGLYETGMLEAQHGKATADSSFEIPKLFGIGLGLVLRGRP